MPRHLVNPKKTQIIKDEWRLLHKKTVNLVQWLHREPLNYKLFRR
ncbi:MAG: hypothetical protein ACJAZ5_000568 [Alloalcanivorax venustensis]|jgi:hypothetical protein